MLIFFEKPSQNPMLSRGSLHCRDAIESDHEPTTLAYRIRLLGIRSLFDLRLWRRNLFRCLLRTEQLLNFRHRLVTHLVHE